MSENQTIVNHKIIGEVSKCLLPLCQGWLVDTFSGKYWIRCLDPKHNNNQRQIETEEAASQSTFLIQPEQRSQQKKRIIDK
ncbi:MAG: hypothetical protein WBQ25_16500 [Nitrososphaeraceae archaeon]